MKFWKLFLISLLIVVILFGIVFAIRVVLVKDDINKINQHNHTCSGILHIVAANKYSFIYECDTCHQAILTHEIIND